MTGIYKCEYETGGGEFYSDGYWRRMDKPKTITMEKMSDGGQSIYGVHKVGDKFKVGEGTNNPLREYEDGTFCVYFKQAGTPYHFQEI